LSEVRCRRRRGPILLHKIGLYDVWSERDLCHLREGRRLP
jgi:hypothetical protein